MTGSCFRTQTKADEGQLELCSLAREHHVAMEQHCRANADGRPGHRGEKGLRKVPEGRKETEDRRIFVHRRIIQEFPQIVACRECARLPMEQQHADVTIPGGLLEYIGQLPIHRGGQGILLLRAMNLHA